MDTFRGAYAAGTMDVGRRWQAGTLVVAGACIAGWLSDLDEGVLAVALPSIDADFDADVQSLQWTINGYLLAFAAVLVPAGRLADAVGGRRVFLAGAALMAVASLVAALAPSLGVLIGARVVQGAGAALLVPAAFALLAETFPADGLAKAVGWYGAAQGVGLAIGPVAGGALADLLSWRWIFFLSLPPILLAVGLVLRSGHRSPGGGPPPRAAPAATLGAAMTLIVVALIYGPDLPLVPTGLALVAGGVLLLVATRLLDRRSPHPLLDFGLLAIPSYAAVVAIRFLGAIGYFAVIVMQSIYLQSVLDHGPLLAGVELLPLAVTLALVAVFAGAVTERFGPRAPAIVGLALMTLTLLALATASTEGDWWPKLALAYAGFGAGVGLVITSVRTEAMVAVDERRRAVAAGTLQLGYQLGAALGVAGITVAVSQYGGARLDDELRAAGVSLSSLEEQRLSSDELAGKLGTADVEEELPDLGPGEVDAVVEAMGDSFVAAMNLTMVTCAGLTAVALTVAVVLLGRRRGPLSSRRRAG
jgi:MFS transporter, DHA2 family, methylenomycin A resistance protein